MQIFFHSSDVNLYKFTFDPPVWPEIVGLTERPICSWVTLSGPNRLDRASPTEGARLNSEGHFEPARPWSSAHRRLCERLHRRAGKCAPTPSFSIQRERSRSGCTQPPSSFGVQISSETGALVSLRGRAAAARVKQIKRSLYLEVEEFV